MADDFQFDVFLSHSSRDKDVVRDVAERLRHDGLKVWFDEWEIKPDDSIPSKLEHGLEHSRVLVLCMSASAFGSDWAQLESGTFQFRDPLNKERRFIPLRLDDAPIKGPLAQFQYINWLAADRKREYVRLLEGCQRPVNPVMAKSGAADAPTLEILTNLRYNAKIWAHAFSGDCKMILCGSRDNSVRLWNVKSKRCLKLFNGHTGEIWSVAWSPDQQRALSGSSDCTVRLWDLETGDSIHELKAHHSKVTCVAWSPDQRHAISASADRTMRLWEVTTGTCIRVFAGHRGEVNCVAWSADSRQLISGANDCTLRVWDVETGKCQDVLEGHTDSVSTVGWNINLRHALSGSRDGTVRSWDVEARRCLRVLEGHTDGVSTVAWNSNGRHALSGAWDGTVRLWDVETGRCLRVIDGKVRFAIVVGWGQDQRHAWLADQKGNIRAWDLTDALTVAVSPTVLDQVEYRNAKVLLVGDTSSGKTGIAHRLATGFWKPSDGSTIGAWCTQWKLPDATVEQDLEQEIWLWDFGGQADQRLVHQLYMDHAALILLLFNADKDDVLPGLREWQSALRRSVSANTPLLLVAGRVDAGFRASRGKLQSFANEQGFGYFETSAKEGTGCCELTEAIKGSIPWEQMERRTSPRIFKLIKDAILRLRDEGQVLHTFKELRELLWRRLPNEPRFADETLQMVIGLLDGPGAVKELDYGTYVLLQPEWVNAYAQAVIRTLRQDPTELGCLPLRSIAEGRLLFQSVERDGSILEMKRLPPAEERVVLGEMERQLELRGLCLRQGDKLVFPSHCGRDRPAVLEHPSIFVSYAVRGFLDDIYATLVVKLADSESFRLNELWRDAADFVTLGGNHQMGIKLTRESGSDGDISVYFSKGVTQEEQVIFANYINGHLEGACEQSSRLRHYVCPKCHTPKGNPQVLMQKLLVKKKEADTECDKCGERFPLWDALEKKFASDDVRQQVEGLQAIDALRLDSRRKGKLLALEVGSRITSADQKCFEIPATEDEGIDMEVEFTNDDGKGTGKRLYLQLKSGNSHLKRRKDGSEVFAIADQRWVTYWLAQKVPIMLVIGTFSDEERRAIGDQKVEFADVRWMEISSVLKRLSKNGRKPVKQIEFHGERMDMASVRRWRDKMLRAWTS
jgi:small GTP-binding protein